MSKRARELEALLDRLERAVERRTREGLVHPVDVEAWSRAAAEVQAHRRQLRREFRLLERHVSVESEGP